MKKGYKIGLFGELISESSINSILEQGFDVTKIKPIGSRGGGASKATTSTIANPKAPERAKEKTKIETTVENYKNVAIEVDKLFKSIYDSINKLYTPSDAMYKLWYPFQDNFWGDNEAKALKELFGTSTISSSTAYTDYFLGDSTPGSKFWGVYVLPNLKKIIKYKGQVQKTGESKGWAWEIEEDEEFWKHLNDNIEQLWTVFKDIIYKSMRYYDRTMYTVTYRPTLSAYSDNAPLLTYSFNLDF
jgi:hypothetical protein